MYQLDLIITTLNLLRPDTPSYKNSLDRIYNQGFGDYLNRIVSPDYLDRGDVDPFQLSANLANSFAIFSQHPHPDYRDQYHQIFQTLYDGVKYIEHCGKGSDTFYSKLIPTITRALHYDRDELSPPRDFAIKAIATSPWPESIVKRLVEHVSPLCNGPPLDKPSLDHFAPSIHFIHIYLLSVVDLDVANPQDCFPIPNKPDWPKEVNQVAIAWSHNQQLDQVLTFISSTKGSDDWMLDCSSKIKLLLGQIRQSTKQPTTTTKTTITPQQQQQQQQQDQQQPQLPSTTHNSNHSNTTKEKGRKKKKLPPPLNKTNVTQQPE